MRLRYIQAVNFQRSELTNFQELAKKHRWRLGKGEVACLISMSGNQLIFVYALDPMTRGKNGGNGHQCLRSERLRLTHGSWNPMMLANYADQVGLELDGIERFEKAYEDLWTQEGSQLEQVNA